MSIWQFNYPNFKNHKFLRGDSEEINAYFLYGFVVTCQLRTRATTVEDALKAYQVLVPELCSELGIKAISASDLHFDTAQGVSSINRAYVRLSRDACIVLFSEQIIKSVQFRLKNTDVLVHIDDQGVGRRVFDSASEQISIHDSKPGQTYYVESLIATDTPDHYTVKGARLVK